MDESKLTEEIICLKGEVCTIKESNINMKEDIVNLKADVKKLEESDNTLNIAIKSLSMELSSSINSLKTEISNSNKETRLIFQNAFDKMEADRETARKDVQFLLDREKKRELEIEEDRKAVKDVKWNTIKVVLATLATGMATAFLLWLGIK